MQGVRAKNRWEDWVLYILEGIEQTAEENLTLIKKINAVVEQTTEYIKVKIPKVYSKELVDLLFFEFYTKIVFIENGLGVSRKTASGYLIALEEHGMIYKHKRRILLGGILFFLWNLKISKIFSLVLN